MKNCGLSQKTRTSRAKIALKTPQVYTCHSYRNFGRDKIANGPCDNNVAL